MDEKRQFPRKECRYKTIFKWYEGNPDNIDISTAKSISGKGIVRDISKGGAFIVASTRVSVNLPIDISFMVKNEKYNILGSIVRTGLIKNNPSEVAQRYADEAVKEDAYIAVQFDNPLESIPV